MINRSFLFMAGEFRVSMQPVFCRESWTHTMTPDYLVFEDGKLRRSVHLNEELKGVIHYADVQNKQLEQANLELLMKHNIPCWPDPEKLYDMLTRDFVLICCINSGFVCHDVSLFLDKPLPYPFVVKVGNVHRGQGKHLIKCSKDLSELKYVLEQEYGSMQPSTILEPYFEGISVRVLIIGENVFGIRIDNDNSWIKNSPGAEISLFIPSVSLGSHALAVMDSFGLDVAGVDYILEPDGRFHFLEINQYPGLDVSDEILEVARKFLNEKMDYVEGFERNKL